MCFKRKKNSSFSLTSLLGIDFNKIGFESMFPFESYATTSVAVATSQKQASKLMLLNDSLGVNDPEFNGLLRLKLDELQRAVHVQNPSMVVEAAWTIDSPSLDDFIHLNSATPMSDVLDYVFQSNVRQRRPILVNIERAALLQEKPSRLSALIARDALFHIGFLSLLGHHGEVAKRIAHRLLYSGRVAYIGFEMDDFTILARKPRIDLDESVIALLADQDSRRTKANMFIDESPLND